MYPVSLLERKSLNQLDAATKPHEPMSRTQHVHIHIDLVG